MYKRSSRKISGLSNLPLPKTTSNAAEVTNSSCFFIRCRISPPMPTDPITASRILLLFLTISLLLFVFLAFFTVYFCRSIYIHHRNAAASNFAPHPPRSLEDAPIGLDPSFVASFPTFTYSWVMKNLHAGKHGLECAVCLFEFVDNDVLRLLTACSHVFHTDCIDVWLMSHTTCPYCCHELNPDVKKKPEVSISVADAREVIEEMRVREEDEQHPQRCSGSLFEEGQERRERPEEGDEGRNGDLERRMRSKSTGHSNLGWEDPLTLRLPKDVKERIPMVRNWTGSCVDFQDFLPDLDDTEEDRRIERSGSSERDHRRNVKKSFFFRGIF